MNIDKKIEKKLIRKLQKQFDYKQGTYTFDNKRIENIGLLNHTLCQKIRGLKDIPHAQTARDYLETFVLDNIEELLLAN